MNKNNIRWVLIALFVPLLFSFKCGTDPVEKLVYNAAIFTFVINNQTGEEITATAQTISFSDRSTEPENEIGRSAARYSPAPPYYSGWYDDYSRLDASETAELSVRWSGETFNEDTLAYSFLLTLSDGETRPMYAGWLESYTKKQFHWDEQAARLFDGEPGHGYGYFTAREVLGGYEFDRRSELTGAPLNETGIKYTVDVTKDSSGKFHTAWSYETFEYQDSETVLDYYY